jgi:hypothetical protein
MRTRNHIRILATAATIAAVAAPAAQASAIGEGGGGAPPANYQSAVTPSPDPGVSGWEVIVLGAGAAVAGVAAGAVGSRQISRRASAHARASHGA